MFFNVAVVLASIVSTAPCRHHGRWKPNLLFLWWLLESKNGNGELHKKRVEWLLVGKPVVLSSLAACSLQRPVCCLGCNVEQTEFLLRSGNNCVYIRLFLDDWDSETALSHRPGHTLLYPILRVSCRALSILTPSLSSRSFSFSDTLILFLSLSHCVAICLSISFLSLSLNLSVSLCISLCMSVSLSFSVTLTQSFSVCLYLSVFLLVCACILSSEYPVAPILS